MPGRGRRVAVALIVLALVLSAGRWGSDFLTERLWEASVSEAVATAGARRALLALALELSVLPLAGRARRPHRAGTRPLGRALGLGLPHRAPLGGVGLRGGRHRRRERVPA